MRGGGVGGWVVGSGLPGGGGGVVTAMANMVVVTAAVSGGSGLGRIDAGAGNTSVDGVDGGVVVVEGVG